ncbi:cation transporter [bacterium]|nr:cation transporter [bacterium]
MGTHCCEVKHEKVSQGFRKVLWIALIVNFTMFLVELASSFSADSVSLVADSIDFFGDAANYAVSLFVLSSGLVVRAKASLLKAATMGLFGVWVIGASIYNAVVMSAPQAETMGFLGVIAMVANLLVALMLYKYRDGDSNMQSVWLCTRNDVIGNIAVIVAASGVFLTTTRWPDLIVAFGMGILSLYSSLQVIKVAKLELKTQSM